MTQTLWIKMANLVFELEKKIQALPANAATLRNIDRMKSVLEESGLLLLNPLGETYNETRTDLEASITDLDGGALTIIDVIKPIIYLQQAGQRSLLQRGIVIAGTK